MMLLRLAKYVLQMQDSAAGSHHPITLLQQPVEATDEPCEAVHAHTAMYNGSRFLHDLLLSHAEG